MSEKQKVTLGELPAAPQELLPELAEKARGGDDVVVDGKIITAENYDGSGGTGTVVLPARNTRKS